MDDTFAAPVDQWTMLDPAYIRLKRLMVLIVWGIEAVILNEPHAFAALLRSHVATHPAHS